MPTPAVKLVFLRDIHTKEQTALEEHLDSLTIAEDQLPFSRPARAVLELSRTDPTRDTFAVMAQIAGEPTLVGIGVLQPHPPTEPAEACTAVTFRGFSIDPRWQGQEIGTRATALAVEAASLRFPHASAIRLNVHTANEVGQRAYQSCGFTRIGETTGRAGLEYVMTRPLQLLGTLETPRR